MRISAAIALALALMLVGDVCVAEATRPNIVFILADDFGYGDLGCYGHPYARTPNIDRLASEGTRFTQFYSTGVTCCPARTGLMTSKFPATYHTYPANGGFGERVTITELLKEASYRVGHFGKWHIGPNEQPGTYGIDAIGADDGAIKEVARRSVRGRDAHIYDNAIRFIENNKEGPFYVNVWSHISHHPINPAQAFVEKFADLKVDETKFPPPMREKFALCKQQGGDVSDHLKRYLADVYSLDEEVGRLLQRIDELGLRDNTIVVFSSDQGPAPLRLASDTAVPKKAKRKKAAGSGNDRLEIRLNAMGSSGGLRGGKHGMYEGGVRVPLIIRWPGHTPAGRVDEQSVISGIDWLPTLCRIVGITPKTSDFDGEDASKAWLGKTHTRTKPLFWKTSNPRSEITIRDSQWKMHYPNRPRGEIELFDISKDPAESRNLAASNAELVRTLTAKIEKWNATLPTEYIKTNDRQD